MIKGFPVKKKVFCDKGHLLSLGMVVFLLTDLWFQNKVQDDDQESGNYPILQ